MSTLHVLTLPALPDALLRCLGGDDGLLLSGDGVYAALAGPLPAAACALECDVRARGLLARWPATVALVDHGGYVDLCVQYNKSLSWS